MSLVATQTLTAELLRFQPQLPRTGHLFTALVQAARGAGVALKETANYHGGADLLVLWGAGAADRIGSMRQQIAAGGHVVCFDAPYWHRGIKYRLSIDAPHPVQWVMRRTWPSARFVADRVPVTNHWNPQGPIVVAGIGRKAQRQYGSLVTTWEREMIAACQQRWRRPIRYRPKPFSPLPMRMPPGVSLSLTGPIEHALMGSSLVITWHSNVAVDAIRMGLPVICRDGAAAAVCPSTLGPDDPQPLDAAIRDRFLANLAWFQWGTSAPEAQGCWRFLQELLS